MSDVAVYQYMGTVGKAELLSEVHNLTWQEFEEFVAALWELQGWTTQVTPGRGDEGVDIEATHGVFNVDIEIQTKQNSEENTVGANEVYRYAVDPGSNALYSVVVTTSSFTRVARSYADQANIVKVDGTRLISLIRQLNADDLLRDYLDKGDWGEVDFEKHYSQRSLFSISDGFPNYTYESGRSDLNDSEYNEKSISDGEKLSIDVIQGIGSDYEKVLNENGLKNVGDIAAINPVSTAEKTGVPKKRLERWVNRAVYRLTTPITILDGVGQVRAEKLTVNANIDTIGDLEAADPEELAGKTGMSEKFLTRLIECAATRPMDSVERIQGVGKTRADELAKANIYTVADLAAVDPEKVADQVSLGEGHLMRLVDRA